MKYRVVISDRAREMLAKHIRFLAKVNKDAASRLKIRLIEEIRSSQELPHRFPFFNEPFMPVNKYHKMFVENWYLVLFQIKDETVYVDWIVDSRQDVQHFIN